MVKKGLPLIYFMDEFRWEDNKINQFLIILTFRGQKKAIIITLQRKRRSETVFCPEIDFDKLYLSHFLQNFNVKNFTLVFTCKKVPVYSGNVAQSSKIRRYG